MDAADSDCVCVCVCMCVYSMFSLVRSLSCIGYRAVSKQRVVKRRRNSLYTTTSLQHSAQRSSVSLLSLYLSRRPGTACARCRRLPLA